MRRTSIILTTVMAFLLLASGIVFNACNSDPCKSLICKNNGICRDGRCKCASGYEGPNCASKMYEKFIGTWDGSYRCNGSLPDIITNIIAPGDKPNEIQLYDIFDQGVTIKGVIDIDKLTIDAQTIGDVTYSGNGFIEGKYITIYFTKKDNVTQNLFSCVYNATKFVQP